MPPQIARGHTPVRRRTALAAPGSARLPRDRWRSEPRRGDSRSDEAGVCLLRPRVDLRISAPVRSPFDRRTNRVRTNRIPNRAWDDGRRGLAARAVGAVSERVVVPRRGDAPERGAVPRERRATRWFFHLAAEARGERRGGRAGARGRRRGVQEPREETLEPRGGAGCRRRPRRTAWATPRRTRSETRWSGSCSARPSCSAAAGRGALHRLRRRLPRPVARPASRAHHEARRARARRGTGRRSPAC